MIRRPHAYGCFAVIYIEVAAAAGAAHHHVMTASRCQLVSAAIAGIEDDAKLWRQTALSLALSFVSHSNCLECAVPVNPAKQPNWSLGTGVARHVALGG